jgi:hypothetical protein
MQRAFVDEAEQHAFRNELEALLRCGEADAALACVRERMAALAGAGLPIIDLALRVDPETVSLKGWDKLDDTIASEEKSGKTITAIGIDFSWPGHVDLKPDSNGSMPPDIETNYYTDQPDVRFSQATRAEILAGYSNYGSCWQGCFAEIDKAIEVKGMSALYGAVTVASIARNQDDAAGDAYVLAACTSAIVLHLAVRKAIRTKGLPKPLAVLVGSNEDFPFFDAPVAAIGEAMGLLTQGEPVSPAPAPVEAAPTPRLATVEPEASISGRELRSQLEKAGGDDGLETATIGPKIWLDRLLGR